MLILGKSICELEITVDLKNPGFELNWPTDREMFFNDYVVQYYMICDWLNPQVQNRGYREPTVKSYSDF